MTATQHVSILLPEGYGMRGRKRARKKDAKRRGVYRLWINVEPKRGERDREVADALAKLIDYRLRKERDRVMTDVFSKVRPLEFAQTEAVE